MVGSTGGPGEPPRSSVLLLDITSTLSGSHGGTRQASDTYFCVDILLC